MWILGLKGLKKIQGVSARSHVLILNYVNDII